MKRKKKYPVLSIVIILMLLFTVVGGASQVFQSSTGVVLVARSTSTLANTLEVPEQFGPALPVGTPEVYCIIDGYVELRNHQIADIAGPDGTTIVATIQRQENELWLWTIADETMTTTKVQFADDMTPRIGEVIIGIPINETTLMELRFDIVICGEHIYVPGMEYEPIQSQEI